MIDQQLQDSAQYSDSSRVYSVTQVDAVSNVVAADEVFTTSHAGLTLVSSASAVTSVSQLASEGVQSSATVASETSAIAFTLFISTLQAQAQVSYVRTARPVVTSAVVGSSQYSTGVGALAISQATTHTTTQNSYWTRVESTLQAHTQSFPMATVPPATATSTAVAESGVTYDHWVMVVEPLRSWTETNLRHSELATSVSDFAGFGIAQGDFNKEIAISRAWGGSACVDQSWVLVNESGSIGGVCDSVGIAVAQSRLSASSDAVPTLKIPAYVESVVSSAGTAWRVETDQIEESMTVDDTYYNGARKWMTLHDMIYAHSTVSNASRTTATTVSHAESRTGVALYHTMLPVSSASVQEVSDITAWTTLQSTVVGGGVADIALRAHFSSTVDISDLFGTKITPPGVMSALNAMDLSVTRARAWRDVVDAYVASGVASKFAQSRGTVVSQGVFNASAQSGTNTFALSVSSVTAHTDVDGLETAITVSTAHATTFGVLSAITPPQDVHSTCEAQSSIVGALAEFALSSAVVSSSTYTKFATVLTSSGTANDAARGGVTTVRDVTSEALLYTSLKSTGGVIVSSHMHGASDLRVSVGV